MTENNTDSEFDLKIKGLIAEVIGVEPIDINKEDRFSEELHMGTVEITDLLEKISQAGMSIESIENSDILTVQDLLDQLASEELI
jgi:hypothetical protein